MKTSKTNFRFVAVSLGITAPLLMLVPGLEGSSRAATVVVSPTTMNGWALVTTDENGNTPGYAGAVAQMVTGPETPPLGVGSAELATAPLHGDASSQIATDQFDGTPLADITSLSYATYDVANNGQQLPYLKIFLNTNALSPAPATEASGA